MVMTLEFLFGIASAGLYAITINSTADSGSYTENGGFQAINLPLQKLHSNLCGLYCFYLVHYLVRKPFNVYKLQKIPLFKPLNLIKYAFLTNLLNIVNLNIEPGNIVDL